MPPLQARHEIKNVYFVILLRRAGCTYWQCSQRAREQPCGATVTERGGNFVRGIAAHTHAPVVGQLDRVEILHTVRTEARANVFASAATIAENVLSQRHLKPSDNRPALQHMVCLNIAGLPICYTSTKCVPHAIMWLSFLFLAFSCSFVFHSSL